MNFQELNDRMGGDEQEHEWHKHKNGGGWVKNTAVVSDTARVYEDAQVLECAQVYGHAQVYGDAWVGGDARIYGRAKVYGRANVYGFAQVYGDAQIFGDARVYGVAQISGDAWEKTPLYIAGSRHAIANGKYGHIQIGCRREPFAWWESQEAFLFAIDNGYNETEIAEYREYISLIKRIGK